jgi:hypothetical protein
MPGPRQYDREPLPEFGARIDQELDRIAAKRLGEAQTVLARLGIDMPPDALKRHRPKPKELSFHMSRYLNKPYERTEITRVLEGEATILTLRAKVIDAWVKTIAALGGHLDRGEAYYLAHRVPPDLPLHAFRRAFEPPPDEPGKGTGRVIDLTDDEPKVYAVG